MKEYVLLFRMDIISPEAQPTPAQMNKYMAQWTQWIDSIAAEGKLADGGNHLLEKGVVIRTGGEMQRLPYMVNKESVAVFIIILAKDENDAVGIAKLCPILNGSGTSVEVRQTANPG